MSDMKMNDELKEVLQTALLTAIVSGSLVILNYFQKKVLSTSQELPVEVKFKTREA